MEGLPEDMVTATFRLRCFMQALSLAATNYHYFYGMGRTNRAFLEIFNY